MELVLALRVPATLPITMNQKHSAAAQLHLMRVEAVTIKEARIANRKSGAPIAPHPQRHDGEAKDQRQCRREGEQPAGHDGIVPGGDV